MVPATMGRGSLPTGWQEAQPLGRKRRRRVLFRVAVSLVGLLAFWFVWELWTWPDVESLATADPSTTAYIEKYRAERRHRGEEEAVAQRWVGYDAISPRIKEAVLVAEDINFFSHEGFDTTEIRAAVREAVAQRKAPRGASTISQQLARNLWLSPSRNPVRKLKEALLTSQLEQALSKRRILELYLNVAEFGEGIYGVEAAARHYFGRSAAWLGEPESARLAATLPGPSRFNPHAIGADHWRVRTIRDRMQRVTFLDRYF